MPIINLYTTSTIGSYTTGTVTCTKNSANVTGSGTTWSEIVNAGDILTLNDDKFYVIQSVNSNTSLTLDKPFAETTVSNSNYRILLNTAAHFPSDTAAKVERALEQLSDINEAAINNDRTVTAATKVNGKGLSSTMGDINLNPASVNTNRGGTINFHYNQASSATSSIYEDQSGRIRLNGDLNFTGDITSPIRTTNSTIFMKNTSISVGTAPSANKFSELWLLHPTDASSPLGFVGTVLNTENTVKTRLRAMRNSTTTKYADIAVGVDDDGNVFTEAPTPATNDNSTKIATTAYTRAYTSATYLPLTGGTVTGAVNVNNNSLFIRHSTAKGTAPSATEGLGMWFGGSSSSSGYGANCVGVIQNEINASNLVKTYLRSLKNEAGSTVSCDIAAIVDGSGNAYTYAPTPATTDNTTKIATTAFVNSFSKNLTSGTVTKLIDTGETHYCQVYKQNNIGFLNICAGFPSLSNTSNFNTAVLHSSILPKQNIYSVGMSQGNPPDLVLLELSTTGDVKLRVWNKALSNSWIWGNITFPVA